MESTRTDNVIRNMSFGALNRIVSIVFPFVIRTIFIKVFGEEYLGINSLFSSVLQVLNLADLGFATAITASLYEPIAMKQDDKVSALLNSFRRIYRCIGFVILIVGVILTPFIHTFINGEPPKGINIPLYWLIYLSHTCAGYLFYAHEVSLLNAVQRNDLVEKVGVITRIVTSVLQLFVVIILNSYILYAILNTVCTVIYNIGCHIIARKMFPQYVCRGKIDLSESKKLYKNVFALSIQKIGDTVSLSLDSIIISTFLGLKTVAIYGNYFYVISAIQSFITLIYGSITASVGNSIVTETKSKNYSTFLDLTIINIWICGWCSICFLCLFQDFMIIWMGEGLLFSMPVVFVLVMRFMSIQLRKIGQTYKDAAGIWWQDKWKPLVGCIVNFILNILLVKHMGVFGIATATIITYLLIEMPWETRVLFREFFERTEVEYYFCLIKQVIKLFIAGVITFWICENLPFQGVLAIVLKGIICIIIPNVTYVVISTKDKQFYNTYTIVKSIVFGQLARFRK